MREQRGSVCPEEGRGPGCYKQIYSWEVLSSDIFWGDRVYLDPHLDGTSKKSDGMFRYKLFECNQECTLKSPESRDIKISIVNEAV